MGDLYYSVAEDTLGEIQAGVETCDALVKLMDRLEIVMNAKLYTENMATIGRTYLSFRLSAYPMGQGEGYFESIVKELESVAKDLQGSLNASLTNLTASVGEFYQEGKTEYRTIIVVFAEGGAKGTKWVKDEYKTESFPIG